MAPAALDAVIDVIGVFAGAVLFGAAAFTAFSFARRVVPHESRCVRWCAAAVIGAWLLTCVIYALLGLGAFRLSVALALWLALSAVAWTTAARTNEPTIRWQRDGQRWRRGRLSLSPVPAALALAVVAIVGLRTYRGLVAPPLAWDSLTYHLLKAGRWVQLGGWTPELAPDAWSYYEHFPPGGDLFWAWAMLPLHSDALLAAAGCLVWLIGLLAAYGGARVLDASRSAAAGTAAAIMVMPCVINLLTSAYVNTLQLTFLLLALPFLVRTFRSGLVVDASLAIAALALSAAVQPSALPQLAVGVAAVWLGIARRHGAWSACRASSIAMVASAPVLTGFAMTWRATGSPLYPLPLSIGDWTVWTGNAQLLTILTGAFVDQRALVFDPLHFTRVQLFGDAGIHLNLGPGAVGLVGLGSVGIWRLVKTPETRATAIVLLAFFAIPIVGLMSGLMLAQRTVWAFVSGRFLAPAVAPLAVAGARVEGRTAEWVRGGAVLAGVVYGMPRGFTQADWSAMAHFAPYAAAGIGLVLLAWLARLRQMNLVACIAAGLACFVAAPGLRSTRDAFRYRIYEAASAPAASAAFDAHPLIEGLVDWRTWRAVDDGQPRRIAFVAGWDGFAGHNWFRYPLLGGRLQNTVVYVPPSRDGSVIDYRRTDDLAAHADFDAWLHRLREQRVDIVVAGPPPPPELRWMLDHPDVFAPLTDANGGHAFWVK